MPIGWNYFGNFDTGSLDDIFKVVGPKPTQGLTQPPEGFG